jgi:hypothetical protein
MEKNISQTKKCDICESDANCLCFKCINYFCEKCYKLIHDLKKSNDHKKELIDAFVPFDLKCPYHPTIPTNLFCLDEKGNSYLFILFFISKRTLLFSLPFQKYA